MKYQLSQPYVKLTTILAGLAMFMCGCSSTYLVNSTGMADADYSCREMNEKLNERYVKIELKNGRDISAREIKVSDDSVSWIDQRTNEYGKSSIREINRIVMKDHAIGALEGLGIGLLGGGGIGALVGQITVGNHGEWGTGAGAAVGLILGGGTGIIIGLPTGMIVGHRYNYEFSTTEQSDSLQNGEARQE